MKTKKKAPEVGNLPGFRKTAEETAEEEVREASKPDEVRSKERFQISFDLNEDGSPDLTSMRGRTKEKVQAFFSDPRIASAFGAKAPAVAEVQIFNPTMIKGLYSMMGAIEAAAMMRFAAIPEEIAKKIFTYSPAEVEALTPPTCRVLNKYASDWMIKYQDELALASMLLAMTIAKVNMAFMLTRMAKAGSGNIPPNGSQAESEENGKKEDPGTAGPIQ